MTDAAEVHNDAIPGPLIAILAYYFYQEEIEKMTLREARIWLEAIRYGQIRFGPTGPEIDREVGQA